MGPGHSPILAGAVLDHPESRAMESPRGWWVGGGVLVAAAIAEWMRVPEARWVGVAWIGGLVVIGAWWPWRTIFSRLLVISTLALVGAMTVREVRVRRIAHSWGAEAERLTLAAADQSRRDLQRTLALVNQLAREALAASSNNTEATFTALRGLVPRGGEEVGLAILNSDGTLKAWAGRHRVSPVFGSDSLRVRQTPFFTVLERETKGPNGRTAIASLLLAADRVVPEDVATMAAQFERRTGVGLVIDRPQGIVDSLDPFDFRIATEEGSRALYSLRFLPPTQGQAMETTLEEGNHLAVWLLVAFVLLALACARRPGERFALLTALLWVGLRAPAGEALGLDTLFSPSIFFPGNLPDRSLLGPFSRSAGTLLLSTALVTLLAFVAWQRALPRRAIGVTLGVLVLLGAPYLVFALGTGITPPADGVSLSLWLVWHATLLVTTAALLSIAAALFRGSAPPKRSGHVGLGVVLGLVAATIGVSVFTGQPGWPPWYAFVWILPAALVTLPAPSRVALIGIAIVSGSASALMTWAAEVEGRVDVAERDYTTLGNDPDPLAEPTLSGLAARVREAQEPSTASDLYRLWSVSTLGSQGYPTRLTLWRDSVPIADLPLHNIQIADSSLRSLAMTSDSEASVQTFPAVPGVYHVLTLRLPSGAVLTAVIGPRTRLVGPTRFGRLLIPHPDESSLYRMLISPLPPEQTFSPDREGWRREGWTLRGERLLTLASGPHVVQSMVDLGAPAMLTVRGTLLLAFDVVLLSILWVGSQLLVRRETDRRWMAWRALTRSFRFRLGLALVAFFLAPVVAFAAWSFVRLPAVTGGSRDLVTGEMLRDAAAGLERDPPGPGELDRRVRDRSLRVGAELGFYRHGRLIVASRSLLVDLALIEPVMPAAAYVPLALNGETGTIVASGRVFNRPHRTGYRIYRAPGETDIAVLSARQVAGDLAMATQQADVAMILLLTMLLGGLAAILGAQFSARSLSRPVADLRMAAEHLGQGEQPPKLHRAPPVEFLPVFNAFGHMAEDIRASQEALEASRRQTAAVLATVATGVIGLDAGGRVLIANPTAESYLGSTLTPGTDLREALPASWHQLPVLIEHALVPSQSGSTVDDEMVVDGRRYSLQCTRLDGVRAGLVLALHDITDATQAARILAWGEMANQVAHEIKNPLTPMRLGVQHLQRVYRDRMSEFGPTLEETSHRILREIDRLDAIARAFSRYAAPSETLEPLAPVRVAEVAEEVRQLYHVAPDGIELEVRADAPPPGPMLARRTEVQEVLINLIENARAADATRITITVQDNQVVVADNGCGISPDLLPHIFEPRFSTTTSGSGLGLPIVRRLVEGWGASVEVTSTEGMGTEVSIRSHPETGPMQEA